jgi:small GTP-binding protein
VIGNAGVGKTNLLKVAIDCEAGYSDRHAPTLDPEVATLSVPNPYDPDAKDIQAQVWDTAGQERYMAVTKAQYRRADGALIVFDASNPKSFKAARTWAQQV